MDAPLDVVLPRGTQAGAQARRYVEQAFRGVIGDNAVGNLKMVVSELVNNAILHGTGVVALRVLAGDALLRVEVSEEGSAGVPALREEPGLRPGGRGLRIVDALAAAWGADEREGATCVWAELAL